ncbi:hypothetical protein ZIOFF_047021 [Zingiber officinale]|uniref:Uncharacterized protein n=1 Tax=Zingiber officinale TaxID=94328 RepID=A0A8J5FNI9_ZINOF|nr:hypothetical protein ZIOFF_047021 [Zingiber officinale]
MASCSPPLRFIFKAPDHGIFLPMASLDSGLCVSSRSPMFSRISTRHPFDSAWIGIRRSHLPYRALMGGFVCKKGDGDSGNWSSEQRDGSIPSASSEESDIQLPTQAQSLVEGSPTAAVSEYKSIPDIDYLMELLTIQQQGPRSIGFFGTRNMGFMHQQLIEILSYAMVITLLISNTLIPLQKNHIFTSGASGTNAAVIRGALRAEKPELLTVILPQSLKMQPPESQELLSKASSNLGLLISPHKLLCNMFASLVQNLIEMPKNDNLPLLEASRLCNMDILSKVQQVICFAFHDSRLLLETCQEARKLRKLVTLFYLD